MKVLHLTYLLSSRGGGIPPAVLGLAEAQRAAGLDAAVVGVRDPGEPAIRPNATEIPPRGPLALGYAPGMLRHVLARDAEVLHLHGLFTWPSRVARSWGRATSRPVVVSPHGMLEPWALARSAWKKRIFRWCVEDSNLRNAACFHALSSPEACDIRRQGLRQPVAVLPNGVDPDLLSGSVRREGLDGALPQARGRRVVLFLGRVHPKKGLPALLEAWALLRREGALVDRAWLLIVAGPDQLGHTGEVKARARALGLAEDVLFAGPLHGSAKRAAFGAAELFVLPSLSEGLPMAALEAMACEVPVLLTRQCNLDVESLGAGLVAESDPGSLASGLRRFLAATEAERAAMGEAGRRATEKRFAWPSIAAEMAVVYRWLAGGADRPACVEILA